jgi:hypothetical protein
MHITNILTRAMSLFSRDLNTEAQASSVQPWSPEPRAPALKPWKLTFLAIWSGNAPEEDLWFTITNPNTEPVPNSTLAWPSTTVQCTATWPRSNGVPLGTPFYCGFSQPYDDTRTLVQEWSFAFLPGTNQSGPSTTLCNFGLSIELIRAAPDNKNVFYEGEYQFSCGMGADDVLQQNVISVDSNQNLSDDLLWLKDGVVVEIEQTIDTDYQR